MKVLTISIAAYNIENYIAKALDSVIEPTIIDKLEIIIENDGSSDQTASIAEKYASQYPDSIIVINKENGGYGSTINNSISLANGRFFKQLDGDDLFFTSNLPDFIRFLEKCEADYVMTPYIEFYEDKDCRSIMDPCKNHERGMFDFKEFDIHENVSMHSLCIKTEVLKKMDRKLDLHCLYTDIEFCTYPIINANSFYIYDKPIYMYRLGDEEQSVSKKSIMKHFDDFLKMLNHVIEFYYSLPENLIGQKKFVMAHVSTQLGGGMKYLCYYPLSRYNRTRLKNYMHDMKEKYPDVYRETLKRSKVAKALVYTGGLAYPIINLMLSK